VVSSQRDFSWFLFQEGVAFLVVIEYAGFAGKVKLQYSRELRVSSEEVALSLLTLRRARLDGSRACNPSRLSFGAPGASRQQDVISRSVSEPNPERSICDPS
jgi:hypothetical protein